MSRPHPNSTLFPYTTLFRSFSGARLEAVYGALNRLRPEHLRSIRGIIQYLTARSSNSNEEKKEDLDHGRLIFEIPRSEEHTSELQSLTNLVCRLLLEKKNKN